MKKLSLVVSIAALFAGSISAIAFGMEEPEHGVYGKSSLGICLPVSNTFEQECNPYGQYQCYVYLVQSQEIAPAYSQRWAVSCELPLRRW